MNMICVYFPADPFHCVGQFPFIAGLSLFMNLPNVVNSKHLPFWFIRDVTRTYKIVNKGNVIST
jgi:hypothetical protein